MNHKLCKLATGVLNTLTVTLFDGFLLAVFSALLFCWVILLSGCCGGENADLVVRNESGQEVWSIELDYEDQTQWVQNAGDHPLLESGQSYGLELEEGASQVTVVLSRRWNRELARQTVDFAGERLYLTLERDGTLTVTEEWPNA